MIVRSLGVVALSVVSFRRSNIEKPNASFAQTQQVVLSGDEIGNRLLVDEMAIGLQGFHVESVDLSIRAAQPGARAVDLIESNGRDMVHRQLAIVQLQLVVVEEHGRLSEFELTKYYFENNK